MMKKVESGGCNLHGHTTRSDGKLTPEEYVSFAKEKGNRAIAITDHNQFDGYLMNELREKFSMNCYELINGTELTARYKLKSGKITEVHMVGLLFDDNAPKIQLLSKRHLSERESYVRAILEKIKEANMYIAYEEVRDAFPLTRSLGRVHVAEMMSRKGYVKDLYEGLDEYIGFMGAKRCYVDAAQFFKAPWLDECVNAIQCAQGIPIIAHPLSYRITSEELEEMLKAFKNVAGDGCGMEVYYKDWNASQVVQMEQIAKKYEILSSCGSDYHGFHGKDEMDAYDYSILDRIIEKREKCKDSQL